MLYKDVSSAVINNGFETGHFPLFLIAAEILAIKIISKALKSGRKC